MKTEITIVLASELQGEIAPPSVKQHLAAHDEAPRRAPGRYLAR